MYLNKVILYGNLTRDPESRALTTGGNATTFAIATNHAYTKDGERKEQTEFHNIVAFGKVGELFQQYLKKGSPLFIEGRLQTRSWEKDGVKQFRTEVVAESFQFGPKQQSGGDATQAPKHDKTPDPSKTYSVPSSLKESYPDEEINPEDIPF